MVIIMNFFVLMVVLSPFTAIIPGIYGLYLLYKKRIAIEKNYLIVGMIALFTTLFISGIINKSILSTAGSLLLVPYIGIVIISQNYFISRKRIENTFKCLVSLSAVTAVIGIIEKIVFILIEKPTHRIFSTYGNPNMTGAWFASMILVGIFLKYKLKNKDKKINIYLILMTIALLLTESSGAFVAFLASISAYFLVDKNRDKKKIIIMALIIMVVFSLFIFIQKNVNSITLVDEVKVSFSSRYDVWIGSIQMFLLKPILGWGSLGTLEHGIDFMYNNGNIIHSHNIWLTFLVSGGIVALTIYLFIKYNIIKDLIKIYKRHNDYICILVSLNIMVIVQGLVDCSLYAPQLAALFMMINAIAINIVAGKIKGNKHIKKVKIKRYERKIIAS